MYFSNFAFFSAIPPVCESYKPPHNLTCINAMWADVGCVPDGLHSPDKLFDIELEFSDFNGLNLKLVT